MFIYQVYFFCGNEFLFENYFDSEEKALDAIANWQGKAYYHRYERS